MYFFLVAFLLLRGVKGHLFSVPLIASQSLNAIFKVSTLVIMYRTSGRCPCLLLTG